MSAVTTVWILTEEHNDYDQHGEYFRGVWAHSPSKDELIAVGVLEETVGHVLAGGGRRENINGNRNHYDENWYYLRQHSLSKAR